jgi:transmembrane 9 superfamily protein 2/4
VQLPYSYYDLPFCKPKRPKSASENLGEVLEGDMITSSLYDIEMKVPDACKILCKKTHSKQDMRLFRSMIDDEYRIDWIVDNLPGAMMNLEYGYVTRGFPVGFVAPPAFEGGRRMHYLYNHVRILLSYHEDAEQFKVTTPCLSCGVARAPTLAGLQGSRIVGFQIIPFSINHMWDRKDGFDELTTTLITCNEMNPAVNDPGNFQVAACRNVPKTKAMSFGLQSVEEADEVVYTYDVKWVPSDITWSHRWDIYLKVRLLFPGPRCAHVGGRATRMMKSITSAS